MTKYEILALMINEAQFEGNPFTIAAKLATCLEPLADRLSDEELAELVQIGGAIFHFGVNDYKRSIALEDIFPAVENWPVPSPTRKGVRKRSH